MTTYPPSVGWMVVVVVVVVSMITTGRQLFQHFRQRLKLPLANNLLLCEQAQQRFKEMIVVTIRLIRLGLMRCDSADQ